MFLRIVYLLFLLLFKVKSEQVCDEEEYLDMNNNTITIPIKEYCENKDCRVKCCPKGQFLFFNKASENYICGPPRKASNMYAGKLETLLEEINNLRNETTDIYWIQHTSDKAYLGIDFNIYKNGILESTVMGTLERFDYCLDLRRITRNTTVKYVPAFRIIQCKNDRFRLFLIIGRLISCFFMLLVLLVYCLLPSLRNMGGVLLMAHLVSLMVGYIMKAALDIAEKDAEDCLAITPAVYFFLLASFFWLNIISYDIWHITKNIIPIAPNMMRERRFHRMKFLWYCVYAWGTPALLTVALVIIDQKNLYTYYKPPFENCFGSYTETLIYLHIPIGIMTAINIILFSITAYNIWKTKRNVKSNINSRNNKKNENTFMLNIQLFIIMGLSWTLEVIPTKNFQFTSYVLINLCNVCIGVPIFYFCVCKKSIYKKLCKRFNIGNTSMGRSTKFTKTETTNA